MKRRPAYTKPVPATAVIAEIPTIISFDPTSPKEVPKAVTAAERSIVAVGSFLVND